MVLEKVTALIAKEFHVDAGQLTADTRLEEDLNIDSLDAVELVMGLEDTFHVSITDETSHEFKTVGQIVDFIAGQTSVI